MLPEVNCHEEGDPLSRLGRFDSVPVSAQIAISGSGPAGSEALVTTEGWVAGRLYR